MSGLILVLCMLLPLPCCRHKEELAANRARLLARGRNHKNDPLLEAEEEEKKKERKRRKKDEKVGAWQCVWG